MVSKSQLPRQEAMAKIPVNGKVLKWARTIRGFSLQDAALLLGIPADELEGYESGKNKPLVGFLRHMSKKYQINFVSLLMPEPLPARHRPTDHRARLGRRPLSIDTLLAIEEVNEAIEAFHDIAAELPRIVPRLNIGTANLTDDPEIVAARERRRFGVSIEEQHTWHSLGHARNKWRQRIEDQGIFTYMIPMPPVELSGFSLLRSSVAAICVNDREPTEGAKIFTLFHEYAHLLLRRTGISDENNTNRVERFCNEFAASFLIPLAALTHAAGDGNVPREFTDAEVKRLATRFRVSNRAMALRLEETGLAPNGFYEMRTGPWDIPIEPRPTKPGQEISQVILKIKRFGKLHAATAIRAFKRHVINSFDASQLIGLHPSSFGKVEARIG